MISGFLRQAAASRGLAALAFLCFALLFTHLPDGPYHAQVETFIVSIDGFVVLLLLLGRHWLIAGICAVLLIATLTRF